MRISIIAAMSKNRVIGNGMKIPWKIPGEQKIFKRFTIGNAVVMGRKTYESIGKALPNRLNIVVTRQKRYKASGCLVVHSLDEAIEIASQKVNDIFIAGGEELYRKALPIANRICLTTIHSEAKGDAFFPEFSDKEFIEVEKVFVSGNQPYTFLIFERVDTKQT